MGKHKKSWRYRFRQKLACSSLERHIPGVLYTVHRCPNLLGAHFSSWGAGPQVAAPPLNMTYGTHHTAVTVPLYTLAEDLPRGSAPRRRRASLHLGFLC